MKKALLFAILALSFNVFAQSKHPSSNSMENVQGKMEHKGRRVSDIHSERNLGQAIKPQTPKQRELIQIFDSIHYWQWDTVSTGWKIASKIINIVYDAHNNLISYVEQNWNGSVWENSYKYTYTYDANNNQTSELDQDWNGTAWVNSFQVIYTYDANNNLTNELRQIWNGSAWVDSDRDTYTYDANNNLISELGESWNGSAWVNDFQSLYAYDANNFTQSLSYKEWNYYGTKVMNGDSSYYYFHTVVGINDLMVQEGSIIVYPNPSSGKFTIRSNNNISFVEIYNLLGERIYSNLNFNKQTSNEIDLSDRCKGIYFIKIYNGTKSYNRKIVVH